MTSELKKKVLEIKEKLEELRDDLEAIKADEEDRYDNLSESKQEKHEEEHINFTYAVEDAVDDLYSVCDRLEEVTNE